MSLQCRHHQYFRRCERTQRAHRGDAEDAEVTLRRFHLFTLSPAALALVVSVMVTSYLRGGSLRVISRSRLRQFWRRHADAEQPLQAWYRAARSASWQNLAELRKQVPHADLVGDCTVFNIKGNDYRLVTKVYY